jgi:hypothetical protein
MFVERVHADQCITPHRRRRVVLPCAGSVLKARGRATTPDALTSWAGTADTIRIIQSELDLCASTAPWAPEVP